MEEKTFQKKKKRRPAQLPKKYVESRKFEIPLYDPQTGEANPHYEELTGKKNPLLEKPKDVLSSTKNGVNHKIVRNGSDIKVPEFGRPNRFLLFLPKEFGVEPYFINRIGELKMKLESTRIFGIKFNTRLTLDDLEIIIKLPIAGSIHQKLKDSLISGKTFDFKVEMLEPNGVIYETWSFYNSFITGLEIGPLEYTNSSVIECKLKIKANDYKIS